MWTRKELKDRAKQVLRTSYWKAFLVGLLLTFVSGGLPNCSYQGGGSSSGSHNETGGISGSFGGLGELFNGEMNVIIWSVLIVFFIIMGLVIVATIAFGIFLGFPLLVGARQYYKQAAQDDVNMNYLGYAFVRGRYMAIVKGMLWMTLLNFLWFLLLIIPGFVKRYAYSMVPYILADHPGIGTKRAVELSNQMTRGHKWNMFVLDLSFIGWYLLGILALIVGVLFVMPYVYSTHAELYLAIRRQALEEGISSRAELNLPDPV
ncbi:DUF975 family protein [Paenibacillus sp. NPDC056579]|uniref:DUF975 family protein n=1 Tax=unclassified Paenibacillus TaxID=185978 RepID=UPI001EF847DD|nr:DUF975 family protein [Paenibacillus sp. H1-7]ULL16238.1 DUF975 family protein [Paenibacillus sp. H1-7]